MAEAYPLDLRTFMRDEKSRSSPATFSIAQPRRGFGYVDPIGTDVPVFWDVTLRFTRAEAQTFRLWFVYTLQRGLREFTIPIDTEFGQVTYTLQFLPDSLLPLRQTGEVFEYRATVMARAEIVPPSLVVALLSTVPNQDATQGVAFSLALAPYFTGGTLPYTYAIESGTLPAGLSLNTSSGVVSGTPTTAALVLDVVFRVTDSLGSSTVSNPVDFNVATAGDPNYSNVYLLLHGDRVGLATNIVDNGPAARGPTSVGAVTTSDTQSKFGGYSLSLPAGAPLVYLNTNLVNLDFTHEMWVYELSTGSGTTIMSQRIGSANGWALTTQGLRALIDGTYSDTAMSWTRPSFNAWHHYAWTRQGSTLRMFIDGALVATRTGVTTIQANSDVLRFGQADAGSEGRFNGFLDDVRLTLNVARYTAAFTPPTLPFPNS